jgi:xanthine dehydrogenase accessory factor
MRDIAPTLKQWLDEGRRFAVASVIGTSGSAPRSNGSAMGVREDGLIVGSVSGGCVEGAVAEAAMRTLRNGVPELLEFGPETEARLFEVGLSCGGAIRVWVEPATDGAAWLALVAALLAGKPVSRATRLSPSHASLAVVTDRAATGDQALAQFVQSQGPAPGSHIIEFEGDEVFVDRQPSVERLVIVGAVHIAVPLVKFANELGMETIVVDPRSAFARAERFPIQPDLLIAKWPEEAFAELGLDARTHVVSLTHDSKIDDRAIYAAAKGGAVYIGALGGSKTQEKRRSALAEMGLSPEDLARIHGPVGLDIGAESPEEIALSIIAEIVKFRHFS